MLFPIVQFLKRNRYTTGVAGFACFFSLVSCDPAASDACSTSLVDFDISSSCQRQNGSPIFMAEHPNLQGESAVTFERNVGQAESEYDFVSFAGGVKMRLNSQEAWLELPTRNGVRDNSVHASLAGARHVSAEGLLPIATRSNYLIGNDASRWITDVPNYRQVRYPNVYPGIDLVYHGSGNRLEHDFIVAPGADPAQIRLQFNGVGKADVASDGSLEITLGAQKLSWLKPTLYQQLKGGKVRVEGRYKLASDGSVKFEVGVYDPRQPLTIDPVLAYSTYFGGPASESASRVAVDASGNSYFTGGTTDAGFAVSSGAAHNLGSAAPAGDAIIVKMSADGKTALYTTHLGGTQGDVGLGIALDSSGNVYIAGLTNSTDFPVTTGAYKTKNAGTEFPLRACFVTKLNNAGTALLYSTYLGGSNNDSLCTAIGVDATGNAYVTGTTISRDFPTVNALQPNYLASGLMPLDAFVTKISPDGSKLLYSTFLNGTATSGGTAIAVDAAGNAYVTGATTSRDFPVTTGAFQTAYGGAGGQRISLLSSGDAFVTKLDPSGKLSYSTFLGGSQDDIGVGIAIDAQGNAYIAGSTMSPNFPVRSPFQAAFKGAGGDINYTTGDGFVAKLNPQGTALLFSSFLGGAKDDRAAAIALDASGNIFVAGNTFSPDFPVTAAAQQPTYKGDHASDAVRTGDAFFVQISSAGALVHSTYVGGTGNDFAAGIAVDSQGAVVVSGGTDSTDFLTTPGALQSKFGGGSAGYLPAGDAFLLKFGAVPSNSIAAVVNAASYAAGSVSPGEIVTIVGSGIGPDALQNYSIAAGRFGTQVSGTRILFDGVPAPIIYVSAKQVAVVVPYAVAGRTQTLVTAEYNGLTSPAFPVPVTGAVPGLFSADSSGAGQGAILNQDTTYNSASLPAFRGSVVVLYGTGEGQTAPGGIDGLIAATSFPKPTLPVSVTIGGQAVDPASILYSGAAPGSLAGLFQINVKVPCTVSAGNVPVVVQVGTGQSQKGLTLAVRNPTAAEGACPAP